MTNHENIAKIRELIKDIRVAMLTTVEPDGHLRSRPMATQTMEFDGDLWFFTYWHSGKTEEVQRDQRVNVSYASDDDNRYVSISGVAEVVRDRAKAEQLWSPALKAWFPKGLEDPELALLRVVAERAEYWDAPSSTVVKMVGFTKAVLTGERYDPGENRKLQLQR
ncbi:MAG: pyridoxamine 5'-phosphate oxidase family protein [Bryobacteraceae bacterium]|nr:pyridoxamine 5'-phosphate oxidase family protein [Bryobacteraceae bacterium]